MKIPHDCNGIKLVRALRRPGYETQRQTGSRIRLTTRRGGEHHVSVPNHGVLKDVAEHHGMKVEEVVRALEI